LQNRSQRDDQRKSHCAGDTIGSTHGISPKLINLAHFD